MRYLNHLCVVRVEDGNGDTLGEACVGFYTDGSTLIWFPDSSEWTEVLSDAIDRLLASERSYLRRNGWVDAVYHGCGIEAIRD